MEGLVLCEAGARPGACMVLPLARRGAMVGVEADCGKPYCCCAAAEVALEEWAWEGLQMLGMDQVLLCKAVLLMVRKGTAVHRSSRGSYPFQS